MTGVGHISLSCAGVKSSDQSANSATDRSKEAGKKPHDGGVRARKFAGRTLTGKIGKWRQGRGKGEEHQYSFIKIDGDTGGDLFVHKSAIEGKVPEDGNKVSFEILYGSFMDGAERKEYAAKVKRVDSAALATANTATQADDGDDGASDDGIEITPGGAFLISR